MANKHLRRLLRSGLFFFTPLLGTADAAAAAASSHVSCLPLAGRHCLPSPCTAASSSADEGDCVDSNQEEEVQENQLAWSRSGSQLRPDSFNFSVLQRACSRSHLHDRHHEVAPAEASKYTRSWSSASLHMGRHRVKLPHKKTHSFSGSQSKEGSSGKCAPKGHVAVYVEAGRERHVVPIAYLSHPQFQELLERAAREFGYGQQGPGLRIPCSLSELLHTLHLIRAQY